MSPQDDGPLRPCDNLQGRFDEASKLRIPPYNWVPPEWKDDQGKPRFADNCEPDADFFDGTRRTANDVKEFVSRLDSSITDLLTRTTRRLADPMQDFSHDDPEDVKVTATGDPAGPQSPGMDRLQVVFEWILTSFRLLCAQLNQAMDRENREEYEQVRNRYIERLRDLDDHDPQRKKDRLDDLRVPGKRGYGRIVKWVHVAPTILQGKIVELRVIVHWNPHSSSSGKPILHG